MVVNSVGLSLNSIFKQLKAETFSRLWNFNSKR